MANVIVQNKEKAYGYTYSSLASLAAAGIEIPKMRTVLCEGKQFVQYLDESGEWQMGAEVVVPAMKGMNEAQAYGSALTYARRYTVMMARSVACTDDQLLEAQEPEKPARPAPKNTDRAQRTNTEPVKSVKTEDIPPENRMEPPVIEPAGTVDMTTCSDCGKTISRHGKYDVMTIAQRTLAGHGRVLCWDCATKASLQKKEDEKSA